MKLTWFGGTTLRVYLGGAIIVVDADEAREFGDVLRDTGLANATTAKEAARSTSAKGGTGGINSQ